MFVKPKTRQRVVNCKTLIFAITVTLESALRWAATGVKASQLGKG